MIKGLNNRKANLVKVLLLLFISLYCVPFLKAHAYSKEYKETDFSKANPDIIIDCEKLLNAGMDKSNIIGMSVAIVDEKDIITGNTIKAGDTLIGIASSGVHSNGFSLVRQVFKMNEEALNTYYESLGKTLGEELLIPTKIYVNALKSIKDAGIVIKGCSHITGGGFYENIPRMLPDGVRVVINKNSYEIPSIFKTIAPSIMYLFSPTLICFSF
jgi:hypothetical protein